MLQERRPFIQRTATWYAKPTLTFVDAVALVRRHLWIASLNFSKSSLDNEFEEVPAILYACLIDSLAYAARTYKVELTFTEYTYWSLTSGNRQPSASGTCGPVPLESPGTSP